MKHVYITREIPHIAVEILTKAGFRVTMNHAPAVPTHSMLKKNLKAHAYDAVITLLTDTIDQDILSVCPSVKIISNYAVGFNNIDLKQASLHGIVIANTPVSNEHVAEFTLGLIIACATRIVEADQFVRSGNYHGWDPGLMLGVDLKGATLGLVGSGRIGTSVAERAYKALGMNVVYYDPVKNPYIAKVAKAKRLPTVHDVLAIADFISLHVPLTKDTQHLIGKQELLLMKNSAYLINTSRGPVIDESALVEALQKKLIAGAALDVYEFEPKISKGLLKSKRVILTPHIASARSSCRQEMAIMAAENIVDFFGGKKPKGLVT